MRKKLSLQKLIENIKKNSEFPLEFTQIQIGELKKLLDDHNKKIIDISSSQHYRMFGRQIFYKLEDFYTRYYLAKKLLKNRDSSSLNAYLIRYGEKFGIEFYNQKTKKCIQSKENFFKKYGEQEGTKKYKEYCKSVSISLDNCIRRYGEQEGKNFYKNYWNNTTFGMSVEKFKLRYGEEKGTFLHEQYKKDSANRQYISSYIERYGEEEGIQKFNQFRQKKKLHQSKHYFIEKLKEKGFTDNQIADRIDKRFNQTSLKAFKNRYGEEKGINEYQKFILKMKQSNKASYQYYENSFLTEQEIQKHITKEQLRRNELVSSCSKESLKYLIPLKNMIIEEKLENVILMEDSEMYLVIDSELREFHNLKKRMFFYDFTMPNNKIIIEYHGVRWHKKLDYDSTLILDIENLIQEEDLFKKWYAEKKGYKVLLLRSWDIKNDLYKMYDFFRKEFGIDEKWLKIFI